MFVKSHPLKVTRRLSFSCLPVCQWNEGKPISAVQSEFQNLKNAFLKLHDIFLTVKKKYTTSNHFVILFTIILEEKSRPHLKKKTEARTKNQKSKKRFVLLSSSTWESEWMHSKWCRQVFIQHHGNAQVGEKQWRGLRFVMSFLWKLVHRLGLTATSEHTVVCVRFIFKHASINKMTFKKKLPTALLLMQPIVLRNWAAHSDLQRLYSLVWFLSLFFFKYPRAVS